MYIRCLSCRGVTWLEGDCRTQGVIECNNCAHALPLRNVTTQDSRTQFEDAVAFAEASKIDLPSANSVLLGVMTLREALSIQGKSTPVPAGAPSALEQAADDALRALEQQRAKRAVVVAAKEQPRIPEQHSRAALFAAFGMLLASIAISVVGWSNWAKEIEVARALERRNPGTIQVAAIPDPPQDRRGASARLHRNRDEQVVQIVGRTPESVLRTFCAKTGELGRYEPVELATPNPPRLGTRVGVLRDYRDLSQSYAIWIQQRRKDRRWIAGTGKEPLEPFALDYAIVGETRFEVTKDETDPSS